ncbi:PREDICTED: uncharacterized protein LOC107189229 [Dufourea novaeangliae]|uniref:uncharacterized protein LOC107189229 n=1 Tax=Dufourea novaeangliae TaxID=178035 RepID=UPI000767DA1F|nr:PREDICTED: uncharacterized protein LOC107189229 [Dufourea novaeangliae]
MNRCWTILAIAAVLYGLCGSPTRCDAVPTASPTEETGTTLVVSDTSNANHVSEQPIQNRTRSVSRIKRNDAQNTNLTTLPLNIASGILKLPRKVIGAMIQAIRQLISRIQATFRRWNPFYSWSVDTIDTSARLRRSAPGLVGEIQRFVLDPSEISIDRLQEWFSTMKNQIEGHPSDKKRRSTLTWLGGALLGVPRAIVHPVEFLQKSVTDTQNLILGGMENVASEGLRLLWRFLSTTGIPWLHDFLNRLEKMDILPPTAVTFIEQFNTFYGLLQFLGYVQ